MSLQPCPPDPNSDSDGILYSTELAYIRAQRAKKLQELNEIDQQLIKAKEEYAKDRLFYEMKGQEPESIAPLLDMHQNSISRLQGIKSDLENDAEQLLQLVHPIKQCPIDVLQAIFEELIKLVHGKARFIWISRRFPRKAWMQAASISHVCRRWREITLKTPLLWRQLEVSMVEDLGVVKSLFEAASLRAGSIPVNLELLLTYKGPRDINDVSTEFANACNLPAFQSLGSMTLTLFSPLRPEVILQLGYSGTLEHLMVVSTWRVSLEGTSLLKEFPRVENLELNEINVTSLGSPGLGSSLRVLNLRGSIIGSGLSLSSLTRIEELTIMHYSGDWTESIVLPMLRKLTFRLERASLLARLFTDRIENLSVGAPNEAFLEYTSRHPSIRSLDIPFDGLDHGFFIKWATSMLNLESLFVREDSDRPEILRYLTCWEETGMATPPFPKLTRLELNLGNVISPTFSWALLEPLARDRFLPHSRDHRMEKLVELKVCVVLEHDRFKQPPVFPVLEGASRVITEVMKLDLINITFTWSD